MKARASANLSWEKVRPEDRSSGRRVVPRGGCRGEIGKHQQAAGPRGHCRDLFVHQGVEAFPFPLCLLRLETAELLLEPAVDAGRSRLVSLQKPATLDGVGGHHRPARRGRGRGRRGTRSPRPRFPWRRTPGLCARCPRPPPPHSGLPRRWLTGVPSASPMRFAAAAEIFAAGSPEARGRGSRAAGMSNSRRISSSQRARGGIEETEEAGVVPVHDSSRPRRGPARSSRASARPCGSSSTTSGSFLRTHIILDRSHVVALG